MSEYDHEDNREMDEIPPSEPVGSLKVEFGIPVPTVEQIAGQVARQVIAVGKYGAVKESALHQLAEERLADAITRGSGGELRITVHAGGELVPPFGVFDAVANHHELDVRRILEHHRRIDDHTQILHGSHRSGVNNIEFAG